MQKFKHTQIHALDYFIACKAALAMYVYINYLLPHIKVHFISQTKNDIIWQIKAIFPI